MKLTGHGMMKFDGETGEVTEICRHDPSERCEASGFGGGEIVYEGGEKVSSGVVSDAYRAGWEKIFGNDQTN